MRIPKEIFSLQTRIMRDPILQRRLVRETKLSPNDARDKVASLRSRKDPFFRILQKVVEES